MRRLKLELKELRAASYWPKAVSVVSSVLLDMSLSCALRRFA